MSTCHSLFYQQTCDYIANPVASPFILQLYAQCNRTPVASPVGRVSAVRVRSRLTLSYLANVFFVRPRWRPPFPLPERRFCRGETSPCSIEPGSCSSCKDSSGQAYILSAHCSLYACRGTDKRTPAKGKTIGHVVDISLVHREIVPRQLPMEPIAWQQQYSGQ